MTDKEKQDFDREVEAVLEEIMDFAQGIRYSAIEACKTDDEETRLAILEYIEKMDKNIPFAIEKIRKMFKEKGYEVME